MRFIIKIRRLLWCIWHTKALGNPHITFLNPYWIISFIEFSPAAVWSGIPIVSKVLKSKMTTRKKHPKISWRLCHLCRQLSWPEVERLSRSLITKWIHKLALMMSRREYFLLRDHRLNGQHFIRIVGCLFLMLISFMQGFLLSLAYL